MKFGKNEEKIIRLFIKEGNIPMKTSVITKKLKIDSRQVRGSAKRLMQRGYVVNSKSGRELVWYFRKDKMSELLKSAKKRYETKNVSLAQWFISDIKMHDVPESIYKKVADRDDYDLLKHTTEELENLQQQLEKKQAKVIKVMKKTKDKKSKIYRELKDINDDINYTFDELSDAFSERPIKWEKEGGTWKQASIYFDEEKDGGKFKAFVSVDHYPNSAEYHVLYKFYDKKNKKWLDYMERSFELPKLDDKKAYELIYSTKPK